MNHLNPPKDLVAQWILEASDLAFDKDRFHYVACCAAAWGRRPEVKWTSLKDTGLESELLHPLLRAGIKTVEQLRIFSPAQLMCIRNLGPQRVGRILAALKHYE